MFQRGKGVASVPRCVCMDDPNPIRFADCIDAAQVT